jgi:hypothetical protein
VNVSQTTEDRRLVVRYRLLMVTAGLTALAAWGGAIGLVSGALDLTEPIERRLPFHSPVFGGVALAIVVAAPCTVTAWMAWRRDSRTGFVAVGSGAVLIAWILVQIATIRELTPLQPICAAIGGLLVVLGRRMPRSAPGAATMRS